MSDFFIQPAEEIIEEVAPKSDFNVWKFVADVSNKKEYLFNEETEKEYKPFIINHALSAHIDTVFYAQEMNERSHLEPELQHDYYFHSIRAMWRGQSKWLKTTENEQVKLLQKYYGYNYQRAEEALKLHTEEDIEAIIYSMRTGGINGKTKNSRRKKG